MHAVQGVETIKNFFEIRVFASNQRTVDGKTSTIFFSKTILLIYLHSHPTVNPNLRQVSNPFNFPLAASSVLRSSSAMTCAPKRRIKATASVLRSATTAVANDP